MEENKEPQAQQAPPTPPKLVKTFADDMAGVIESDRSGLIKKILTEEEEREREKRGLSPESRQNKIFIGLGILFLACSVALLAFLFFTNRSRSVPLVDVGVPQMIFTDTTNFITVESLAKEQIWNIVAKEREETTAKEGGIEGIYLTENKKVVGLRRFISLLGGNLTFLDGPGFDENFLLGAYNGGTNHVFLLFKMHAFPEVFPNLRAWEKKMFYDLYGFLDMKLSSETNYLLTKDFEDGFVENKNARILYKEDGSIALLYTLADDNHIVVTDSREVAREIIARLAGNKIAK